MLVSIIMLFRLDSTNKDYKIWMIFNLNGFWT